MKIILTGGGTGGPVFPLLAVREKIVQQYPKAQFLLVGTSHGPEKEIAKHFDLAFESVPSGKLRRYFSISNIFAPFKILAGFIKSIFIIRRFKPDLVFGAGAYVSVPVILAAAIMRKKTLIHQQDVLPTLSNIILAPFVSRITVSFKQSATDFPSGFGLFKSAGGHRIFFTGNPVREEVLEQSSLDPKKIKEKIHIKDDMPVVLVLGGATGAAGINQILLGALPELVKICYVIHSTGPGKSIIFEHPNYKKFEMIPNMGDMYKISDLVISRAGLATISELSALKKPSIIIPMPNTHQVENAIYLSNENAAIVLNQELLTGPNLVSLIRKLLVDVELQAELAQNIGKIMPGHAAENIAKIVIELCHK